MNREKKPNQIGIGRENDRKNCFKMMTFEEGQKETAHEITRGEEKRI